MNEMRTNCAAIERKKAHTPTNKKNIGGKNEKCSLQMNFCFLSAFYFLRPSMEWDGMERERVKKSATEAKNLKINGWKK